METSDRSPNMSCEEQRTSQLHVSPRCTFAPALPFALASLSHTRLQSQSIQSRNQRSCDSKFRLAIACPIQLYICCTNVSTNNQGDKMLLSRARPALVMACVRVARRLRELRPEGWMRPAA